MLNETEIVLQSNDPTLYEMRRFKKKILNTLYLFSGNQNYNRLHCISKSIRDNKMADLRLSSAEICPCCITESEFPSGIGVYMTQNAIQWILVSLLDKFPSFKIISYEYIKILLSDPLVVLIFSKNIVIKL